MAMIFENVILSGNARWLDYSCSKDRLVRIRAILSCDAKVKEYQALIAFQFKETVTEAMIERTGLTMSAKVGPYAYFDTRPGTIYNDFTVILPESVTLTKIGIQSWGEGGPIVMKYLWLENIVPSSNDVEIALSIDVEALPGRAPSNHVRKLIYGEWDGREHGITRLCDIFKEYGIKANFMLEYAQCAVHGDKPIFQVGEELQSRGHDVHLHLHSEVLMREQKWDFPGDIFPSFSNLDYSMAKRILEYGCEKYKKNLGRDPLVFRCGGFQFNKDTILAAQSVGLRATSNLRTDSEYMKLQLALTPAAGEIFRWENGIIELPMDSTPEPLSNVSPERFISSFERSVFRKRKKLFNIVIHSWSLLSRDADGFPGPPISSLEKNLRAYLDYLVKRGKFVKYSDLLSSKQQSVPNRQLPDAEYIKACLMLSKEGQLSPINQKKACNICGTSFKNLDKDICGYCKSRTRHRVLKWLFDSIGNPFMGKKVLACHATPMEKKAFLEEARELFNFDVRPMSYLDAVMDIQDMSQIKDNEYDCFMALHVLNHVKFDTLAISEIARVLKPGGLFVVTVPYRIDQDTQSVADVTQHYGKENLEKYGVGTYRYYGLDDFVTMLNPYFTVSRLPGYDPLSDRAESVFIGTKRPEINVHTFL